MITSYSLVDQKMERGPVPEMFGIQSEIIEKIYGGSVYQEFMQQNGNVASGDHFIHRALESSRE